MRSGSNGNFATTKARMDFIAHMRGAKQTKGKIEVIPNRIQMRRSGLNITQRTGSTHARIRSGAKLAKASFYTLVQIRQPVIDGLGNVTGYKKIVVPRAMMQSE